jgi:hypothetical protein
MAVLVREPVFGSAYSTNRLSVSPGDEEISLTVLEEGPALWIDGLDLFW